MKKLKNSKGFTLMEMLIVVAIIAILIAIAIPTFTNQLEKAREAADLANIRNAYSEAMVEYLSEGETIESGNAKPITKTTQPMTQSKAGWQTIDFPDYLGSDTNCQPTKGQYVEVSLTNGANGELTVTCTAKDN